MTTPSSPLLPLETERLVLRELAASDFAAVHAYASDPVVVRYMPWGPNSENDTWDFLGRAQELANARPRTGYELAVVRREGSELLGAIGLHLWDETKAEAMLGYCYSQASWGHGYGTEAGRVMIWLGFAKLGLERIWAGCDSNNDASVKVLQKIGMIPVERHESDTIEGSPDSLMFCIRSEQWITSAALER